MADVRFEQATRIYPGTDIPAVDQLDLAIDDGEFMVLVGPSGSGKTTALRMLAGLEEVDGGAIYIADAALYLRTHRPELGIDNPYELTQAQLESIAMIAIGSVWLLLLARGSGLRAQPAPA